RKTAIAAADVEHPHPRLEEELAAGVPPLGGLGRVEAHPRRLEIGAGILQVLVEEERVEPAVEVVVLRDVAAGARQRVQRPQMPGEMAEARDGAGDRARPRVGVVRDDERKKVVDRAGLDGEAAVHERLAELQLGVEEDRPLDRLRCEADADLSRSAVAEAMNLAFGVNDLERAGFHRALEEGLEQSVHRERAPQPDSVALRTPRTTR